VQVYWHTHNHFLEGLAGISGDILAAANRQVIPEYPTDVDKHNPVDWVGLYNTLQTHKDKLAQFTVGESDLEDEEDEEGETGANIEIT